MVNIDMPESKKRINNLVALIKSHYPHLYKETGGKFIRKILRQMLDGNDPCIQAQSNTRIRQDYTSNDGLTTKAKLK